MNENDHTIDFRIPNKELLSEKIAQRLLLMIREKRIRPGDMLPPERELASLMNVSRPSLREALKALSLMGIIEHRQGSGTKVASLEPSRLIEHIDLIFSLNDSTLMDLFDARKILEVGLAGLAAERISDEQIQKLEDVLVEGDRNIDNPDLFSQCDIRFHEIISESAGNSVLKTFMTSVAKLSVYSRRRTGEFAEVRKHTRLAHREIHDSLKKHNPEDAKAAMLKHLKFVEERFKRIVASEGLQEPKEEPYGHRRV